MMKFTIALSLLAMTCAPAVLAAPPQSSVQPVPVLFKAVRDTNALKCPTFSTQGGCNSAISTVAEGNFFEALCQVNRQFVLLVSNNDDPASFVAITDIVADAGEAHKTLSNCEFLL